MADGQTLRYPNIRGYRIGEEIGGGGFSKVFRAIDDNEGRVAACKVVNLFISPRLGYGTPNVKELEKEVKVHRSLQHEHILHFIHHELVDQTKEAEGWVPGLYMLLELAIGGDLFDKIAPDVGVPEDLAKFYFSQMVAGIDFLHEKGVAHRDIKPENLLLAANGNLKISDFGLCAVFRHKGKTRMLSGRCGSLPYVAPELGGPPGSSYAAEPVDVWGMGVVLYTLLVGNTPWDEPSDSSPEFGAFVTGELLQYDPWTRITGQAKVILLAMLTIDPSQRITISGLYRHPWCMTPSQLRREDLGDALTQGLRSTGMMAFADPTYGSQSSQAAYMSGREPSQWVSQLNPQESQFLRATGNLTQAGEINNITTRFYVALSPEDTFALLRQFLEAELGAQNLVVESSGSRIRVAKPAGSKSVQGVFRISRDDLGGAGDRSLVVMRRGKGSILHWRAFWWGIVRHQQLEQYIVRGE